MLKIVTVILIIIIGISDAARSFNTPSKNIQHLTSNIQDVGIDFCPLCINEAVEVINVILNVILDEGILASCEKLCNEVANKTKSKIAGDLCYVACDGFGLDEFIRLIITMDLDPIWYCEMAKVCEINDHGDATYTNFGVLPNTAPEGTKFILDCSFKTVNGTGTSMLRLNIIDSHNETSSNDILVVGKQPGTYTEKFAIDSVPVGIYNVTAQFCNGECDSHHPHSSTYAVGQASFTVTKKK